MMRALGRDAARKFGVIAQEVEPLFPDAVGHMTQPGASEELMTVKYDAFGLIAVKALQELKAEKDAGEKALKRELVELKEEILLLKGQLAKAAEVEEQVTALKRKIDAQQQAAAAWEARFGALEKAMAKAPAVPQQKVSASAAE